MKFFFFACAVICLATGCAHQANVTPINPSVPYSDHRGPGAIGSPPLQQGSVPTR